MLLEIENVTREFSGPRGTVCALDGATLAIDAGDFVAVQGPSGCGKTTLLLAAGGLLRPTSGRIRMAGEDPYALSAEARAKFRARRIGFVFQQFHLVPYLTVLENILAPSLACPNVGAAERAHGLIRQFHLEDRASHRPAALSTGERQRTALARAILNGPALLLADEPTGNLDGDNATIVLDYLAEFARSGGAVLLVTHDVAAASRADRRLRMDGGRVCP